MNDDQVKIGGYDHGLLEGTIPKVLWREEEKPLKSSQNSVFVPDTRAEM